MADLPEGTPSFLRRKVAGIPVLYLLGVAAVVLAVVAWRMKSTTMNDAEAVDPSQAGEDAGSLVGDQGVTDTNALNPGYVGFTANPTPTYDPTLADTTTVPTMESWIQAGASYADAKGIASYDRTSTVLQKYANGEQLSTDEGGIRDAVIKAIGAPPELVQSGGTAEAPVKMQGNPPTTHTIKGGSDDTYGKLAALYYQNSDSNHIDVIQAANTNLANSGPFMAGTRIMIPRYSNPKFYVTKGTKDDSADEIAAKNGTNGEAIRRLNDGMKFPVKKGTRVRVA